MIKIVFAALAAFAVLPTAAQAQGPAQAPALPDFPREAQPGECWTRVPTGAGPLAAHPGPAPGGQAVWTLKRGHGPEAVWRYSERPGAGPQAMPRGVGYDWVRVECDGPRPGFAPQIAQAPVVPPVPQRQGPDPAMPHVPPHGPMMHPAPPHGPVMHPPGALHAAPHAPPPHGPMMHGTPGHGPMAHPPGVMHAAPTPPQQGFAHHGYGPHGPGPHAAAPHAMHPLPHPQGGLSLFGPPPPPLGHAAPPPFAGGFAGGFAPPPPVFAPPPPQPPRWFGDRYLSWPGKR